MSRIRKVKNEEVKILPQSPNADISSGLLYEDKSKLNIIQKISDTNWMGLLMIGSLMLIIIPAKIISLSSSLDGGFQKTSLQVFAFVLGISLPLLAGYLAEPGLLGSYIDTMYVLFDDVEDKDEFKEWMELRFCSSLGNAEYIDESHQDVDTTNEHFRYPESEPTLWGTTDEFSFRNDEIEGEYCRIWWDD